MIKSLLYLFLFLFIINFSSAQTYKQVKISLSDHDDVNQLYQAGLDFDHPHLTKDNAIIVFIDEDDYALLKSSGFNYEVLIEDWIEYYENLPVLSDAEKEEVLRQTRTHFSVSGFGFGSMGGFYTFDEASAELDTMFLLYPDIITEKVSIGTSNEGRPIYMVKISDNPGVSESEPQVLYTALHHAREPESMMQMIYFMYYLLENYSSNAEAEYLINNREMYFIPVLNPDGYEYNRQTNPNGGGMWRKNRKNNDGSYGVDLNRNYGPYEYWNAPNGGSSTDLNSDTYRGIAPFSEPETAAIRDFLASKNLKNTLNYHTYSNLLIYHYLINLSVH
ncbi:MAG: M14 family metallopeptidase [Ignavibacteriaceae bacterium]